MFSTVSLNMNKSRTMEKTNENCLISNSDYAAQIMYYIEYV